MKKKKLRAPGDYLQYSTFLHQDSPFANSKLRKKSEGLGILASESVRLRKNSINVRHYYPPAMVIELATAGWLIETVEPPRALIITSSLAVGTAFPSLLIKYINKVMKTYFVVYAGTSYLQNSKENCLHCQSTEWKQQR